jgi:predicted dehydrogenase
MLNIGIIGTGWFSKVHANILSDMEGVRIKAVCGTSAEKAESFALEFEEARGYGALEEMLETEKLDAVYVCVPPFAHGDIEMELINRGIPFFVEKPLGANLETPREIIYALKKKTVITSVGYHFRYRDSTIKLVEELKGCHLGMVTGCWMGSMPAVPWWRNQAKSGGQFVEQTTHLLDLLRYSAGEPEEVTAVFGNKMLQDKHENVTVSDIGSVILKMKNGTIATLTNTCLLPDGVSNIGLEYYHDSGILKLNQEGLIKSARDFTMEWKDRENPYFRENRAFIQAVASGDSSGILSDYHDAYQTQKVAVAALKSAETGMPVKLAELE